MERKALIIASFIIVSHHGFSQDRAYSLGLSAPFFAIPGVSFMVESRVPLTYGSSIVVNANCMPFSRQFGAGVTVDAQIRFYTTKKRSAPVEAPLNGFFIGPVLSFGALSLGRNYEGNGQMIVGGAVAGNRFKLGYSNFYLEPYIGVEYGLYKRFGDYTQNYYKIVPWLVSGIGLVFAN